MATQEEPLSIINQIFVLLARSVRNRSDHDSIFGDLESAHILNLSFGRTGTQQFGLVGLPISWSRPGIDLCRLLDSTWSSWDFGLLSSFDLSEYTQCIDTVLNSRRQSRL